MKTHKQTNQDKIRPSTAPVHGLKKSYTLDNFNEFLRDSRLQKREEVDHLKRTYANKNIRINGDVIQKALVTPDLELIKNNVFRVPDTLKKLVRLVNPFKESKTSKKPKKKKK